MITTKQNDIYAVLHKSSFFYNLPEEKYPNILHCLKAQRRSFSKGSTILDIGEQNHLAGIVLQGNVSLSFFDESGGKINVNHLTQGEVFGLDTACIIGMTSSVQIQAINNCEILFLNFDSLLSMNTSPCPFRAKVTANLLNIIAMQTYFLNQRMRILSQKRLRDKIKVHLQTMTAETNGFIHLPFNRNEWAEYLYADRSALSRELSRMQKENILKLSGNNIQICNQNFFNE